MLCTHCCCCPAGMLVLYYLTRWLCLAEFGKELSGEARCLLTYVPLYGKIELPRQGCLLASGDQRWITNISLSFYGVIEYVHIWQGKLPSVRLDYLVPLFLVLAAGCCLQCALSERFDWFFPLSIALFFFTVGLLACLTPSSRISFSCTFFLRDWLFYQKSGSSSFPQKFGMYVSTEFMKREKTNKMQQSDVYYQLLSQHVSGIIMPIFRRTKALLLHLVYCSCSAGCDW